MVLQDFEPFIGEHCETTATACLLRQLGISFSEPMLFGIGQGLGFIIWNMKTMPFPFIGGRIKTDSITKNICENLALQLHVKETSSLRKAWSHITEPLISGQAVGLKLDCYHLDYFTNKIHFAGHYVAMYGYDDKDAFLIDTKQQGSRVKTSLDSLAKARNEKGPMSSKNKSYTIQKLHPLPEIKGVISKAIHANAVDYLNPPIKNIGYKGIEKASTEIKKWFATSQDIETEFKTAAMLMERAGTGGALFRNFYRDFLKECLDILGTKKLYAAHENFKTIASLWSEISTLFTEVAKTANPKYITQSSTLLSQLSKLEKETMERLVNISF